MLRPHPDQTGTNQPEVETHRVSTRFGVRVRQLRKTSNLTQAELAERLSMHRTFLSDVERGRKDISLVYMAKIATGFGMSLSELVSRI